MSRQRQRRGQRRQTHAASKRRSARLAQATGLTAGATLALAGSAQAASFTVTNTSDAFPAAPPGSLRAAINGANGTPNSASTITFASGLTGQINLAHTLLVQSDVTIQGPGANTLAVNGQNAHQDFHVYDAAGPGAPYTVAIAGLTITGGNAGAATFGGAIQNSENLTVADSVISGNAAPQGGAIEDDAGSLAIRGSTLSDNAATAYGGGGIAWLNGPLTVSDSVLSGNTAVGGGGLGSASHGPLLIQGSTISGNTSTGNDGGAFIGYGSEVIRNSTISGNRSLTGKAGGIYSYAATSLTIQSTTIAGNRAATVAGGLLAAKDSATLQNTIVAGNSAPTGPDLSSGTAPSTFNSAFSLIRNTSGATINETVPGSDITGQDPQLGPLQSNGGPTQTMAPALTSPVINKGSAFGLSTDERGLTRPVELSGIPNSTAAGADGSDMGAVEAQLPSNAFTLGKLKLNKKKGTAKITVDVPGPGSLTLRGKGVVSKRLPRLRALLGVKDQRAVGAAGAVKLTIKSKGRSLRRLTRRGKLKLKLTITYTPTFGVPSSKAKKVRLIKKKRH